MTTTRIAILSPTEQGPMPLPASAGQLVTQLETHQEIWGWWLQSWALPLGEGEIMPFLQELSRQAATQNRQVTWASAAQPVARRLVLQGQNAAEALRRALAALHLQGLMPGRVEAAQGALLILTLHGPENRLSLHNHQLQEALEGLAVDAALTPIWPAGHFRLLLADMDSTLIAIECIDEVADHLGLKRQVAAITERSMEGELDFRTSLQERVRLLAGTPVSVLDDVIAHRLQLNPGARELVHGLHQHGIEVGVVSGGFTHFTRHLQDLLGLDYAFGNTLEISDGQLTGNVLGEIIDAPAKAQILQVLARGLDTDPSHCIAMGDGANDLAMIHLAGAGIAYHAKPVVRSQADFQIRHGGLDAVLAILSLTPA
ncbi:phosphoserine phosphatase SerB [Acidithiobacillus sulfuriphilus]|uniref:Phosphoserine phosphatase n=2 Tax=Acidithiobacillus sulfuriphilus TaxID=1867749 RepID=A0A3M8R2D8_9PROT|nr:phosphoserine phosphatase SerB [Acidithiobacillus sulfuriphilus]RNF60740.1 phosphoserine phosphatase SerB [Acidithiobacillus sulfuriphilus]